MIKKRIVLRHLRRLSNSETTPSYSDYVLLGEIVRELFSDDHPIRRGYVLFEKQRAARDEGTDDEGQAPPRSETSLNDADREKVRSLAATALSLVEGLDLPIPAGSRDPDEQAIQRMVDHSFHQSRLFWFTRIILIGALVCVGLGSATFLGINVDIWRRVSNAYEQVGKIEKDADERMKGAAKNAETTIARAVEGTVAKVTGDEYNQAKKDVEGASTKAVTQLGGLEKQLSDGLRNRQTSLGQDIAKEQARLDALAARLDGLEKNLSSILAIEAKIASGTSGETLQLIGAVLEKSAACLLAFFVLGLTGLALSLYCLILLHRRQQATPPLP